MRENENEGKTESEMEVYTRWEGGREGKSLRLDESVQRGRQGGVIEFIWVCIQPYKFCIYLVINQWHTK